MGSWSVGCAGGGGSSPLEGTLGQEPKALDPRPSLHLPVPIHEMGWRKRPGKDESCAAHLTDVSGMCHHIPA